MRTQTIKMEQIGLKIRIERKKRGLTIEQLARKSGISPLTLQRMETGKTNPSISVFYQIARVLGKSFSSFFEEPNRRFVHLKSEDQQLILSPSLKLKLIGPEKMIKENIVVTYGQLKKGERFDPHISSGTEWVYTMKGRCEFKLDKESLILKAGDSVSYDAKIEHSAKAMERLEFISILVKDQD